MKCDYYEGNLADFMICLKERKKICDTHCKVQNEMRLRKYEKLSKKPNEKVKNFKHVFYQTETQCFICGTTHTESIEHIYTQSENKGVFEFRNSCPSNFRRACTICNGNRGNDWAEFSGEKKEVHEVLQTYSILEDTDISFDFGIGDFIYNKENIYSVLYLNEATQKKFKKLYETDYKENLLKCKNVTSEDEFAHILKNTIKNIEGESECNTK